MYILGANMYILGANTFHELICTF